MSSLTFYYDLISQPARAVGLLLGAAKIEHVKYPLKLTEGGCFYLNSRIVYNVCRGAQER